MPHFHRIGHRILFVVGLLVVVGLVGVILLYAQRQERSILEQNERALTQVTDSSAQGLQAIMIRGYAGIAQNYAKRLKRLEGVLDYRILRLDGSEAFVDNHVIDRVNARLGVRDFERRAGAEAAPQVLAASDANLQKVLAQGDHTIYYETRPDGERTVTVLEPILHQEGCERCHEDAGPIRGFVKLTTSLQSVEADIRRTWLVSAALIVAGLGGILALVFWVAQRAVVAPIRTVTQAMAVAARGDLSVAVPVFGDDEIGRMAESFNRMSAQLLGLYSGLEDEQNKLTTIILGARDGIVLTDAGGAVVLANPAAIRLLGKPEAQIVGAGFRALVDDPEWMEWRLAGEPDGEAGGLIAYKGRTLLVQASTIRGAAGNITGSAAIIRDVTEDKRREAELQRMAVTDALTGLYNRRHFDQRFAEEFRRWQRYRSAFSVLMLDVDHFKKFNDTHGHECGDRVLQTIGGILRQVDAPAAIACRYGGEELVVILPGATEAAARGVAEDLRRKIAEQVIDGLRVTVSIGVGGCPPLAPETAEALLKAADAALYRAKEAGRNRVCAAEALTD